MNTTSYVPVVGVSKTPFVYSSSRKFLILQEYLDNLYITFIFDRCHRSSVAATPVKYERDIQ